MTNSKLAAGATFPAIDVTGPDGQITDIGQPQGGADWKLVVIYRGQHCPLCTRYLNELEEYLPRLAATGVDVAAVSGDSAEQLASHRERLSVSFPLFHGLTLEQMQSLGLYISHPRSPKETDHPFAEPGLFVINAQHTIQVVDLSNNPFVRPALEQLVSGLEWIRNPENNYPIRGTWPQQAA